MKKDIEWLKPWFDDNKSYPGGYVKFKINQIDDVKNLSQELPVIPEHVANWIIRHRDIYDLYPALRSLESNSMRLERTYKWYRENTHTFVNAYLTGEYEVEEQRYYALDSDDIPLLERVGNQIQRATTELSIYEKGRDNSRFKLTEQEIKGYDKRYWPFAEPAEQADFRLLF